MVERLDVFVVGELHSRHNLTFFFKQFDKASFAMFDRLDLEGRLLVKD